jgi:uncharacterized membrane protein YeiH
VYLLLRSLVPHQILAVSVGLAVIVLFRLAALYWDIRLPDFSAADEDGRREP